MGTVGLSAALGRAVPLRVAPLDFFGNAFCRFALESGEATSPMVVTGLWFQVELLADGGRIYPLDIYLAPNGSA